MSDLLDHLGLIATQEVFNAVVKQSAPVIARLA
jgi:hypothetical protein